VTGLHEKIGDRLTEPETEILIEPELHVAAVVKRLSRSAASALVPSAIAAEQPRLPLRQERLDIDMTLMKRVERAKAVFEHPAILVRDPEIVLLFEFTNQIAPGAKLELRMNEPRFSAHSPRILQFSSLKKRRTELMNTPRYLSQN
jgi:hypothetical protein